MSDSKILSLAGSPDVERERLIRLRFEEGTLLVDGVSDALDMSEACIFDERVGMYRAPAADYRVILGQLLRAGYRVRDEARAYQEVAITHRTEREPWDHQREAVAAWREAGRRGVVVLPTGSGKSFVAQLAIATVERSTLIVVPTLDLMNQWFGQLQEAFGLRIGLLGGGYHEIETITVCTYHSAAIHMERLGGQFGLIIYDEAHHLPGDVFRRAAEFAIAPFRLGLTATPERADGAESDYGALVGPIVYRRSIRELSGDILADYQVKRKQIPMASADQRRYDEARAVYRGFVERRGIRMGGAGGWPRFLAATNRSEEGRRALKAYQFQKRLALSHRRKLEELFALLDEHREDLCIVFTNDNDSVYRISQRALIPAITHQTPIKERKFILERFNEGVYRAIVTSKVLNEGVDVPEANVAIVLSGTGSVREHVQRLGRILRQREGKAATLYELITADSVEEFVSERRRQHDAYQ